MSAVRKKIPAASDGRLRIKPSMNLHRLFGIAVIASLLSGCTSMRTLHPNDAAVPNGSDWVHPGDRVQVVLNDGHQARFVVREVDADGTIVSSSGARYQRRDIREVKRRHFSPVKTTILAGAMVFVVVMAAYGAALSSLAGGS